MITDGTCDCVFPISFYLFVIFSVGITFFVLYGSYLEEDIILKQNQIRSQKKIIDELNSNLDNMFESKETWVMKDD